MWEHASAGLDARSVVATRDALLELIAERHATREGLMVERYVDGREFNISMLAMPSGVRALPAAEIRFHDFEDRPRIVGYRAKWDPTSFEYANTVRSFEFGVHDAALLRRLEALAKQCWRLFDLRGYARVDMRVDEAGHPWVLEINANPCLTPDSGFVAASARAGLDYDTVIAHIVADGVQRTRYH